MKYLALFAVLLPIDSFAQTLDSVTLDVAPVRVDQVTVHFAPDTRDLSLPLDLADLSRFPTQVEATINRNVQTPISDYCVVIDRFLSTVEVARELSCRFPLKTVDLKPGLPTFSEIRAVKAQKASIERYGWGGDPYFVWSFQPTEKNGYDSRLKLDALYFDGRRLDASKGDLTKVNQELVKNYHRWRADYLKAYGDGSLVKHAKNDFTFEIR